MPGLESLIILLIVGAIAGWLAGIIVKGYGFGLIGNIVVGVVGAFIGNWLFPSLGLFDLPGYPADHPFGHARRHHAADRDRPHSPRGLGQIGVYLWMAALALGAAICIRGGLLNPGAAAVI